MFTGVQIHGLISLEAVRAVISWLGFCSASGILWRDMANVTYVSENNPQTLIQTIVHFYLADLVLIHVNPL